MVLVHGSGGLSAREARYVQEYNKTAQPKDNGQTYFFVDWGAGRLFESHNVSCLLGVDEAHGWHH
jgi:hypothetical protein